MASTRSFNLLRVCADGCQELKVSKGLMNTFFHSDRGKAEVSWRPDIVWLIPC